MRFRTLTVAVLLLLAGLAAWRFWPGEDKKVRARIDALAQELSVPAGEGAVPRAMRASGVRRFFTSDVAIELSDGAGTTVRGRDAIAGYVARMTVPPEGTRVQLLDVQISVQPDKLWADARLDVRLLAGKPPEGPPVLDARMIAVTLRKVDGAWLIYNARVMPTDDSLGVR
jgi:ketosteroid isomerase-like protein